MQIFLTTINPGTYTFFDLGNYTISHPIGPIPLIEPTGEFTERDIQLSEDLLFQVNQGNIELTNQKGETLNSLDDFQTADPGIFVRNEGDENISGIKSFTSGLNVAGTNNYESVITDDDDIPNKKYVDDEIENSANFSVYAWATTLLDGNMVNGLGLTVTVSGTGRYDYVFDTPVEDFSYAVFTQAIGQNQNDLEAEVFGKTRFGFNVRTNIQDDGGGTGTAVNSDHSVLVIGPNNGLPAGPRNTVITPPLSNPKSTLNFDSSDFNISEPDNNTINIEIINKSIFSIIRIESTGADQSNNYNTTTLQPIVLTGNVINLGTASTDFSNIDGTVICNFDGVIRVKYAVPHFTAGARESLKTTIQLNDVDYSAGAYGYIRDANGHRRDDNVGEDIIEVNTGDRIRIGAVRAENSNAGAAVTLQTKTTIIIERLN